MLNSALNGRQGDTGIALFQPGPIRVLLLKHEHRHDSFLLPDASSIRVAIFAQLPVRTFYGSSPSGGVIYSMNCSLFAWLWEVDCRKFTEVFACASNGQPCFVEP